MFFKCSLIVLALAAFALAEFDYVGQYKFLPIAKCTSCGPKTYSKCYRVFCDVKVSWYGAEEFCNSIGMRLATVDNNEQHNEIVRVMNETECRKESLWIGGSNLADGQNYTWSPTGELITFNGWFPGKPDNPTVEHCVEQLINDCGWNDKDCDTKQSMICEAVYDTQCPGL